MAQYADNNYYLDIDGTNVSSFIISVTLSPAQDTVETTAGSGTDHRSRDEGLEDHSISFDIYADDSGGYSLSLLRGQHTITYGEQGSATGKPKHVQSFILTGRDHTTDVEKSMVVYSVSGEAAAAPTTNMFAGGVW